jgi:hypothetical protein
MQKTLPTPNALLRLLELALTNPKYDPKVDNAIANTVLNLVLKNPV